jgi:hypothetical protein
MAIACPIKPKDIGRPAGEAQPLPKRHRKFTKSWGSVPFVGVYYDITHCHYVARVTRSGKTYRVGNYKNAIAASEAREAFIVELSRRDELPDQG